MSHTFSLRRERIGKVPNPITSTLLLFQLIEPLTLEILTSTIRERDSNSYLFLTLYPSFQTDSIWAQSQAHLIMTSESILHSRPSLHPPARQCPIPIPAFLNMFIFSLWKQGDRFTLGIYFFLSQSLLTVLTRFNAYFHKKNYTAFSELRFTSCLWNAKLEITKMEMKWVAI